LGTQDQRPLTRSNASCSPGRRRVQHKLRDRAGSGTAAQALHIVLHSAASRRPCGLRPSVFRSGRWAGPRRLVTAPIQNLPALPAKCGLLEADADAGIRPVQPAFLWTRPNAHAGWLSLRGLTGIPNRCRRLTNGD
jgi:hypothetical protein